MWMHLVKNVFKLPAVQKNEMTASWYVERVWRGLKANWNFDFNARKLSEIAHLTVTLEANRITFNKNNAHTQSWTLALRSFYWIERLFSCGTEHCCAKYSQYAGHILKNSNVCSFGASCSTLGIRQTCTRTNSPQRGRSLALANEQKLCVIEAQSLVVAPKLQYHSLVC